MSAAGFGQGGGGPAIVEMLSATGFPAAAPTGCRSGCRSPVATIAGVDPSDGPSPLARQVSEWPSGLRLVKPRIERAPRGLGPSRRTAKEGAVRRPGLRGRVR